MKSKIIIIVLLLGLLTSCGKAKEKVKSLVKGRVPTDVLVLIDATSSSTKFLKDYQEGLKQLVETLPPQTTLSIGWINDNTEASFLPVVKVKLPGFNFMKDSELDVQDVKKSMVDSVNTTLEKSISSIKPTSTSDILSSFRLAQNYLNENDHTRYLYIFSDMQQNSDPVLGKIDYLSETETENKIKLLKESSKLPDLSGINVCVIGAYNTNNDAYIAYQNFWQKVISASGARLEYYGHAYKALSFK